MILISTPQEVTEQEQQQRSQMEQQLTEMKSLLSRYRERFGELSEVNRLMFWGLLGGKAIALLLPIWH